MLDYGYMVVVGLKVQFIFVFYKFYLNTKAKKLCHNGCTENNFRGAG